ncbi:ADP-ribosylation factor-like protein [Methanopyrus sp.]
MISEGNDDDSRKVKIAVIGPEDAGKTTVVRQLSDKFTTVSPRGKTVGIDFGKCKYYEDVYMFGVPGHLRFKFVMRLGARNADGMILVIDSADPRIDTAVKIYNVVRGVVKNPHRVVVFANKQDLHDALSPEQVEELVERALGISPPVIGTVAIKGKGLREGLDILLFQSNTYDETIEINGIR